MGLYVLLGVWIAGWFCIPHLLLLNKRPTATLAWMWAILLFPVVGPGLYLMIGTERVKRRQMRRRLDFRGKEKWAAVRSHTAATSAQRAKETLEPDDRCLLEKQAAITQLPTGTVSNIEVLHK